MAEVVVTNVYMPVPYKAKVPDKAYVAKLEAALLKLIKAIHSRCSEENCLRLWSKFIRLRDLDSCVVCDDEKGVEAHHICRKSFLKYAKFEPGNGITLCRDCHKGVHAGFNGKPDMGKPMDAQGGEKIETMLNLYGTLLDDARTRGILRDDFYHLSDSTLRSFKKAQGFNSDQPFPGCRLEQAHAIWHACPQNLFEAMFTTALMQLSNSRIPDAARPRRGPSTPP
jgi:hypothetical protein